MRRSWLRGDSHGPGRRGRRRSMGPAPQARVAHGRALRGYARCGPGRRGRRRSTGPALHSSGRARAWSAGVLTGHRRRRASTVGLPASGPSVRPRCRYETAQGTGGAAQAGEDAGAPWGRRCGHELPTGERCADTQGAAQAGEDAGAPWSRRCGCRFLVRDDLGVGRQVPSLLGRPTLRREPFWRALSTDRGHSVRWPVRVAPGGMDAGRGPASTWTAPRQVTLRPNVTLPSTRKLLQCFREGGPFGKRASRSCTKW